MDMSRSSLLQARQIEFRKCILGEEQEFAADIDMAFSPVHEPLVPVLQVSGAGVGISAQGKCTIAMPQSEEGDALRLQKTLRCACTNLIRGIAANIVGDTHAWLDKRQQSREDDGVAPVITCVHVQHAKDDKSEELLAYLHISVGAAVVLHDMQLVLHNGEHELLLPRMKGGGEIKVCTAATAQALVDRSVTAYEATRKHKVDTPWSVAFDDGGNIKNIEKYSI
jgi:hypothetical protein